MKQSNLAAPIMSSKNSSLNIFKLCSVDLEGVEMRHKLLMRTNTRHDVVVLINYVLVGVKVDLFNELSVEAVNYSLVCRVNKATRKANVTIEAHLHLDTTKKSECNTTVNNVSFCIMQCMVHLG